MENNKVIIDLEKYDKLMKKIYDSEIKIKAINNNVLIPKDEFYIKEIEGECRLVLHKSALVKLANSIEGYISETKGYSDITELSKYDIDVKKVD